MIKATECKWFGCVYAINSGCCILGFTDEPYKEGQQKAMCPSRQEACIRVDCEYCRRDGDKATCPNEGGENIEQN